MSTFDPGETLTEITMSYLVRVSLFGSVSKLLSHNSPRPLGSLRTVRSATSKTEEKPSPEAKLDKEHVTDPQEKQSPQPRRTMAELDEELRMKLEGRSGEGGEAGLELEDGKPTAMKRGVKNNMFRLI
ncbi:MAG: hypothetical protein Q9182_000803 [Xanthomendoza sp. 2 TL-2023]